MKTVTASVIIACVALVSVISAMTIVLVTGHDLTPFSIAFGSICTSAGGFLAIIPILRRQGQRLDKVDKQTNGTLSKMLTENREKDMKLALALSLLPEDAAREVLDHTLSRDEIIKLLKTENAAVPVKIAEE